jgi:hypothetical protein
MRQVRTEGYNWNFNPETGFFARWGKTPDEDPTWSPLGPEILDLEISTVCHGNLEPCKYCYKSNGVKGENMSIDTFAKILSKIPKNLTQIAFGIGDIDANPDLKSIISLTRSNGVIPNITINGYRMNDNWYDFLANACGSVAVSRYDNDTCFNAVQELTKRGLKQVNIHQVLCEDSYDDCMELLKNSQEDRRLENLNAILFLMLKPKGRGKGVKPLTSIDKFKKLVDFAFDNKIKLGFDSCSAPTFLKAMENEKEINKYITFMEPCESGLFSFYGNTKGEYFPCSFMEGQPGWETGISAVEVNDFIEDVWKHPRLVKWREGLINSSKDCNCSLKKHCRSCPEYTQVSLCKE